QPLDCRVLYALPPRVIAVAPVAVPGVGDAMAGAAVTATRRPAPARVLSTAIRAPSRCDVPVTCTCMCASRYRSVGGGLVRILSGFTRSRQQRHPLGRMP